MSYVTKFQWDKAKYPTALPLSSLADIINKVQTNENEDDNKWYVNIVITVIITLKGYSSYLLFGKVGRRQNKRNNKSHSETEDIFSFSNVTHFWGNGLDTEGCK